MASGSWSFKKGTIQYTVSWSGSASSSSSSSSVSVTVKAKNTSGPTIPSSKYSFAVSFDNSIHKSFSKTTTLPLNSTVTMGSTSATIKHNSDGAKTVSIAVGVNISGTIVVTSYGSAKLDTISQYVKINSWSLGAQTYNSFKVTYSASPSGGEVQYRLNSGNWYVLSSNGVVSGLSANKTYSVVISIQHPTSRKWTTTGAKSITTLTNPLASFTSWSLRSATHNSFKLNFVTSPSNSPVEYQIKGADWVGKSSSNTSVTNGMTITKKGTKNLTPGTTYEVRVSAQHPDSKAWNTTGYKAIITSEIASTFTVGSSVSLGSALSIKITSQDSGYTHKIQHNLSGKYEDISGLTSVAAGTHSWTVPSNLASHIPNASKTMKIKVITYRGSKNVGEATSSNITVNVPDTSTYNPTTQNITITPSGTFLGSTYVATKSKVKVSFTSTVKTGATISEEYIMIGNIKKQGNSITSDALTAGTHIITGTVIDSRGRSSTVTGDTITVKPYSPPKIDSVKVVRIGEFLTDIQVEANGSWNRVDGENQLDVVVKKMKKGEEWATPIYNSYIDGTTFTLEETYFDLSVTDSYDILVEAYDQLGESASKVVSVGTARAALSIKRDIGIGVGKIHENGALDVDGQVFISAPNRDLVVLQRRDETYNEQWGVHLGYGNFNIGNKESGKDYAFTLCPDGQVTIGGHGSATPPSEMLTVKGNMNVTGSLIFPNTTSSGQRTIIKPGGDVGLALGVPDGSGTNTTGANVQIFHNGRIVAREDIYLNSRIVGQSNSHIGFSEAGNISLRPSAFVYSEKTIRPWANGTIDLGASSYRWKTVYASTGGWNEGSDIRQKTDIENIPEELIKHFAEEVKPKMFKVDGKIHFGYIAQDVERALYKYALKKVGFKNAREYIEEYNLLYKEESYLSLVYNQIAVIKEASMQLKIDKLSKEIEDMRETIDELSSIIKTQKGGDDNEY